MDRHRQATERTRQSQRERKSAPLSSSYSYGSGEKELFTSELGKSSSRQVPGTPIKKLLAEEMSKRSECKRSTPSVIARLMGLDGLAPHQPHHKHHSGISETCRLRHSPILFQRDEKCDEHRLRRKSSQDEQEFKDVYEVLEMPKVDQNCYPVNSNLSEAQMAFIRQKFVDAKRLSTDEKLQNSKEFHDAIDILENNRELLMKFLQQPDSLFTKHLLDLKGAAPRSQCSRVAAVKPSALDSCESDTVSWKSAKDNLWQDTSSLCRRQHHHSSHSYNNSGPRIPNKSPKANFDGTCKTRISPTRIVVLKPNLEKLRCATDSVSPPHFLHGNLSDARTHKKSRSIDKGEEELRGKKNLPSRASSSSPKSRESREIAKKITGRIRKSYGKEPLTLSSILEGYSGDESSDNMSKSDSTTTSESEIIKLTSRRSFHSTNRHRSSSHHSLESSISNEAKKRLSERWKKSKRHQDVGEPDKGSTLGDMLREMKPEKLDLVVGHDQPDRFSGKGEISEWDNLLSDSSSGWKDGRIFNPSRLRPYSAPSVDVGGHNSIVQQNTFERCSSSREGEALNRGRNKENKGKCRTRSSSSRNTRPGNKKLQGPCRTYIDVNGSIDSLDENKHNQSQMALDFEKNDSFELKSLVYEISENGGNSKLSATTTDLKGQCENSPRSPHFLRSENPSTPGSHNIKPQVSQTAKFGGNSPSSQFAGPDPLSPASLKEADHHSPVSVLEAPFAEDISSGSECFERVSSDLHDLRMQLKLLKLESGSYLDGEEEKDVGTLFEDKAITEDVSLESLYLLDVLTESGLDDFDPEINSAKRHSSSGCHLSPQVFENLEKKYGNQTTWLRSERKLLFDRISSGLLEIFRQVMHPHPRVQSVTSKVGLKWSKSGLTDDLRKFLASEEEKANNDYGTERGLDREMQWLVGGDDPIEMIGIELERLLMDDLIAEV